jgi:hypothetical protein
LILKHEDYEYKRNDIALITLERDVVFTDKIQPACLPPSNLSYPKESENENEKSFIAGWGLTELNSFPELLQNLAVNIASSEYCNAFHDVSKPFKGDSKVCLGKYAKLFFSQTTLNNIFYFKHIKIGKEGKSACDGIINY